MRSHLQQQLLESLVRSGEKVCVKEQPNTVLLLTDTFYISINSKLAEQ